MTLSQTILNLEDLPCARANFRFVKDDPIYQTETPYEAIGTLPPEEEHLRSNLKWEERDVPVHDLRQHVDSLSIETNGFEFLRPKELTTLDWDSEKAVVDYLTSLLKFLKERFHTDDVIIYNYNFRKSGIELSTRSEETSGIRAEPAPVARDVHMDGTPEGGIRRIHRHLNEKENEKISDGTWNLQIITIWRPLNAVVDAPLAICDPVSVKQEDLLRVSRVTPEFTGENFYLKYNPQQTYYFFSNQKPDELTLFSSFNSDFPEKIVPHAAFIHKQVDVSLGEAPRESIECRAIVMKRKE